MNIKKLTAILLVVLLAISMMGASSSKQPAKVTGLKATAATEQLITVSWSSAKNAKKYELKYKQSSANSWKSVTTSSKKATVKGLKQNTKYQFKVRGINGSKKGSYSSTITQQTYIKPNQVDVKSIFATKRNRIEIKIQWAAAKNASTYEVATTRLNSDYTDFQYCEYKQIDENHYKPTTTFTTTSMLRANTWYQFKVRSIYNKTGRFQVIYGAWSKPFYACTTSGGRVITGEKDGRVFRYTMNDTFSVGVDDALAPMGVYEISDPTENYYVSDYMDVDGVSFPANFSDICDDNTDEEEYLDGKTFTVGGTYKGYTIQRIIISPNYNDEYGALGDTSVQFVLSGGNGATFCW